MTSLTKKPAISSAGLVHFDYLKFDVRARPVLAEYADGGDDDADG
jgi:hypothetical protein